MMLLSLSYDSHFLREVTLKEKKGNMEILEYWSVPLLSNSIFTLNPLPIVIYLTGSKMKKVFSPFDFVEGRRWESGEGHD